VKLWCRWGGRRGCDAGVTCHRQSTAAPNVGVASSVLCHWSNSTSTSTPTCGCRSSCIVRSGHCRMCRKHRRSGRHSSTDGDVHLRDSLKHCDVVHVARNKVWLVIIVLCSSLEHDYIMFRYLLSQIRLSVVCLSVTFVHPSHRLKLKLSAIFSPLCTLAVLWPLCKILQRSSQVSPSIVTVKCKRGSRIERWWSYQRLFS